MLVVVLLSAVQYKYVKSRSCCLCICVKVWSSVTVFSRIPMNLPTEALVASAATALIGGICVRACVCLQVPFVRASIVCAHLWVHYGSVPLWTSFSLRHAQPCGRRMMWIAGGDVCFAGHQRVGVSVLVWSGDWQLEVLLAAMKRWRNREEEMRSQHASGELDQWHGGRSYNKVLRPCVLMWWKLHLQGNVLDEIVGSIEDGGWQAAEWLERQGRPRLDLNENGGAQTKSP